MRQFEDEAGPLRESPLFRALLLTKTRFIRQDAALRPDAEYLAAKESVEEGEESLRNRAEELDEAIAAGSARLVEHLGRVTGYTTGISYFAARRSIAASASPVPLKRK